MKASILAPLQPVDDQPPVTVMTRVLPNGRGRLVVQGVTVDNGDVRSVRVNGRLARPVAPNYLEWEVEVDAASSGGPLARARSAEDMAGNMEPTPHRSRIVIP